MSVFSSVDFSIEFSVDGENYETLGGSIKPEAIKDSGAPRIKIKFPMKSRSKQPRIVLVTRIARVVSVSRGALWHLKHFAI